MLDITPSNQQLDWAGTKEDSLGAWICRLIRLWEGYGSKGFLEISQRRIAARSDQGMKESNVKILTRIV